MTTVEVSHRHDTDACDVCNAIWQMGRDDTAALREAAQAVVDWFADVEGSRLDCLDALRAALEANRE